MNKLDEHYSQKSKIIVERFKFDDWAISGTETVSLYTLHDLSVFQGHVVLKKDRKVQH